MISTSLATDCFMNDHKRAVDVFNMAREAFVGACQLITLAIVLSNPGTAPAGGAVLVNGGIGAADGMVWISQGEIETGVIEVGFSLLDVYGGLKILNETTDIGKIVRPIKNNKGCINFFPEGSVVDDAAEAASKTVSETSYR